MLHLFQPFTKIMQNRNLNREGVGLGLAVSKKIAKALGGEILVESKINQGSKFTLCFPLVVAADSNATSDEASIFLRLPSLG